MNGVQVSVSHGDGVGVAACTLLAKLRSGVNEETWAPLVTKFPPENPPHRFHVRSGRGAPG